MPTNEPSSSELIQKADQLDASMQDLTASVNEERAARKLAIRLLAIFTAVTIAGVITTAVVVVNSIHTADRLDDTQRCIIAAFTARDAASSKTRDANTELWSTLRGWIKQNHTATVPEITALVDDYLHATTHLGATVGNNSLADCLDHP